MFLSDHCNVKACDIKEDNLINVQSCGICGSIEFKKLIRHSSNPDVNYIKCCKCGAVTFDRILNQNAIEKMYSSDVQYYKDDDSAESGGNITFYGSSRFAKHLLRKYKASKKDAFRLLDFGGGDGELAYAVARELQKKYKYDHSEIVVVDYTNKLYNTKDEKIKMKSAFPLESIEKGEKFDIIIASGVIEHIPKPGADIKRLFGLLNDNGILYFRTPYIYPLRRDLKKIGIEYDSLYPAHIWDLGGKWWNSLPDYVGYEGDVKLVSSRPSIVEKSFKSHFLIALASYVLKAPWFICHFWPYVGGWEAIYKKV